MSSIVTFEGSQCLLIITLVVVEEIDDMCMTDVAVEEGYECFRDWRSSGAVWELTESDARCSGLEPLDYACAGVVGKGTPSGWAAVPPNGIMERRCATVTCGV